MEIEIMKIRVSYKYLSAMALLALLSLTACSTVSPFKPKMSQATINRSIGWLHGNCFAINNAKISSGNNIVIITLDKTQKIILSKIVKKATIQDNCYALNEDRRDVNLNSALSFYIVSSKEPINLAIGVIQRGNNNIIAAEKLLDFNEDGIRDRFSLCSTSEGVKFKVWNKEKNQSHIIWSGYYYLGYDTKPNCP